MFGLSRRKAATSGRGGGFLSRLARDSRGNTLAIVGAALIPLAAMIGSGVDMSRAYMAKTRLQTACDAAALAGRRVMQNDTLDTNVTTEATRFFNYNFNQGQYGTAAFTPTVTRPESGKIRVAASTTIPTTVMRMFGFTNLPLNVTCDAQLSFVNTDVMLVLDVTGSMDDSIGGTKKIVSMRDAVMALYDELTPIQTQLQANGMRLRYGIVPYSSTVNVGDLIRQMNAGYLTNSAEYQTRVAVYDTPATYETLPGTADPPVTQTYSGSISQDECDRYGRNVSFSGFSPSATAGGSAPNYWTRTFENNEAQGVDWGWSGASDTSGTNRSCRRRYTQSDAVVTSYSFTRWSYEPESIDVSNYKNPANSVTYATTNGSGNMTGTMPTAGTYDMLELAAGGTGVTTAPPVSWNGCIEERHTTSTITAASGYTIPVDAQDLNISLLPTDDDTRWRPMFPNIEYRRTAGSGSATSGTAMDGSACPYAARRLQAWTRTDLLNYVNALSPTGNTYHDIGMIWGARLLSNQGIFAADNPDTFNGMPVSRHIIFMTDGIMQPACNIYGAYGVEQNDTRVTGGSSCPQQTERHTQRMKMICNAAKSMGYSIWVIAFGSSLQDHLLECASNANQASVASNRDELIARFRQIGSNIGALRLTQ
jgi:Flp pilus assembly protein TadG